MATTKAKTVCPISRGDFDRAAKPVTVTINGIPLVASPKQFTTGSFGYYANGKVVLEIGGKAVAFQVGVTLTAIGSKEVS